MAITHHWCTPGNLTNGAVYVVRPWPRTVFRHGAAHRKGSNGLCPRGCCGVIPITVACLDTMICTRPVLSTASLVPSEISHCFFGWRHFLSAPAAVPRILRKFHVPRTLPAAYKSRQVSLMIPAAAPAASLKLPRSFPRVRMSHGLRPHLAHPLGGMLCRRRCSYRPNRARRRHGHEGKSQLGANCDS